MKVTVLRAGPDPCSFFVHRDLVGLDRRCPIRVTDGTGTGQALRVLHYNQVSGRLRLWYPPQVALDETSVLEVGADA